MSGIMSALAKRFVNRNDLYYLQWANGHGYHPVAGPLSHDVIEDHLATKITIGLPALDREANCLWCCWDNDHENGNLARIEEVLRRLNLNPLRESIRPGREGHLWLFFDEKVSAIDLRKLDRFVRKSISSLSPDPLEFFPKSHIPNNANGVRMPFGLNRKTDACGATGWFEGAEKNVEAQLQWFLGQQLDSSMRINALARRLPSLQSESLASSYEMVEDTPRSEIFADLNPERKGEYYVSDCPGCKQRRAFFYENGSVLRCNRTNNCGYSVSALAWLSGAGNSVGTVGSDEP